MMLMQNRAIIDLEKEQLIQGVDNEPRKGGLWLLHCTGPDP